jgi:hypothetical protein
MDHLTRAIGEAKDLGELLPLIVTLSQRTDDMLRRRRLSEDDLQQIARPLSTIRLLLTTLTSLQNERDGNDTAQVSSAAKLAERFLDLEGYIKELRNDLARARNALAL